jgi:Zn-dependent peptidase ImmA (M78 family)
MSEYTQYEELKDLAREKRVIHHVETATFGLQKVRQIYRAEKIRVDLWPLRPKVKAVYMCDNGDFSVAVNKTLPLEPKLFALVHELKHHYRDRDAIGSDGLVCGDYNANRVIEIGAEVFAAEFIYPEKEFTEAARAFEPRVWTPDKVVRFKQQCPARVSYQFLCKRLAWIRAISPGQFANVKFRKLEEELLGVPFYRRRTAASRALSS